jgi:hypothetical protein
MIDFKALVQHMCMDTVMPLIKMDGAGMKL